jgi:hypothetical protein
MTFNAMKKSADGAAGGGAPLFATGIVLIALLGDRAFLRMSPAQTDSYHANVRAAVETLPLAFGSWLGTEAAVPEAAVRMLHPNIITARRFQNIATNESVTLLLVHVRDARDILGHYPPVCYPGQGWKLESKSAQDWDVATRRVHGTEYVFTRERQDVTTGLVVDNFLAMRGGDTCPNMDGVELAAQDRQRKFYGAGQIQIVYDDTSVAPQRRAEIVDEFIAYAEPVLRAISDSGGKHEQ